MRPRVWIGFGALCLGAGSAWLYDLFAPGVLTGLPRAAAHNGLVALACLGWTWLRRERSPGLRLWASVAVGGVFLFALPEIVLAAAAPHITQSTEVLVYMLIPVIVVFQVGQQSAGFGAAAGTMRGLLPALAGLGGAALILPYSWPSSVAGRLLLAGLVVSATAAGTAAVAMHRLLAEAEVSLAQSGASMFGVSCLLTAGSSWIGWAGMPGFTALNVTFEAMRLFLVDGPILLLALWLLREMRPVSFSSRLLLVPAVTLVEGILAERPDLGWYGWLGIVLTVGAGIALLGGQRDERPSQVSL